MLPLLALACLAGAVFLAPSRRRGVIRACVGVVVAMLLLVAALAVARSLYLDALSQGSLPRDAASNIFDTLVGLLRTGGRIVVVTAVIVALIVFLSGLPLRRYAGVGVDRRREQPAPALGRAHRQPLFIAVGVVAMIVMLAADPLTGGTVLIVLLLGGAAVGAIAALGAGSAPPGGELTPSPDAGDAQPPPPVAA